MATVVEKSRIETLADLQTLSQAELIDAITEGLPAKLARELAARLEISLDTLAELLRLTSRTLQRRLETGRLELSESERVWEVAQVLFRASEVLESESGAVQWLKNPIEVLGWATPLSLLRTVVGLRQIENILGRIEHGVFS